MSLQMLLGVLRMPPEAWGSDELGISQRHNRYLEAANMIETLSKDLDEALNEQKDTILTKIENGVLMSDNIKLLEGIFPEHRAREIAGVWIGTHKIVHVEEG